jgi:hypothetical protein
LQQKLNKPELGLADFEMLEIALKIKKAPKRGFGMAGKLFNV